MQVSHGANLVLWQTVLSPKLYLRCMPESFFALEKSRQACVPMCASCSICNSRSLPDTVSTHFHMCESLYAYSVQTLLIGCD
ncbi:Hypothetical predicted protein [Podarcis lilfordi]|uniref:Uncharacterized protein n=1 Tax=Podarcis lilfordi TaxID=74358 RepID=A0AA35L7M7_9SAUR|nr:Hypothetical predicted protein [Podarcis lilfordi]